IMMTWTAGPFCLSVFSSPKPSIPAIRISLRTISVSPSAATSSARSALSASVTRWPAPSRVAPNIRRMLRSSSTTRILAKQLLPNWNVDSKCGAFAGRTLRKDAPVVGLDDLLGDIKSESGGAHFSGTVRRLRVRLEDARHHLGRDAGAGVPDH